MHQQLHGRVTTFKVGCLYVHAVRQEAPTEHSARCDPNRRPHDTEQKLRCSGYLSHYPDRADVAWLPDQLAERDAHIAALEEWLRRNEWAFSLR